MVLIYYKPNVCSVEKQSTQATRKVILQTTFFVFYQSCHLRVLDKNVKKHLLEDIISCYDVEDSSLFNLKEVAYSTLGRHQYFFILLLLLLIKYIGLIKY